MKRKEEGMSINILINKRAMLKILCVLSLTIVLFFVNTIGAFAETKSLNITRQQQATGKTNWCWAACSEMIGKYYYSSSRTQTSVVSYIKGSHLPNDIGTAPEIVSGIAYVAYNTVSASWGAVRTFTQHTTLLNAGKALTDRIQWSNGTGHYVVVKGFASTNTSATLTLIDPYFGCGIATYSYTALIGGTTIQSGGPGYLTHSVWIN